ncbi:MAG: tetratricopeptide repeat protein, partial [Verrucomicrobiae bacterium]|nr:tetratricopeptide repeat protein [Verrucomicrobiae bacterium]
PGHMRLQRDVATLAQSFLLRGKPDEAVKMLSEAVQYDSNSVTLLGSLGVARQQAGDPQGAWKDLEHVLQIDSNNVPALVALSGVAIALGDAATANRTADRAMQLAPKLPQTFVAKANAELAATNSAGAITALRQALEVAPASGNLHFDIGNILLLNQNKPEEALAEYELAVAREPRLIPAHVRIAQIRLGQQRTNEALVAIRAARQFAPNDKTLESFEQAILSPPPPPGTTNTAQPTP